MSIIVTSPEELRALISDAVSNAMRERFAAVATTPQGKYFTKKEVALLCKCSQRTVENRMAAGAYRYTKEGNRVKILAEDVHRNLDKNTVDNRFRNT